ncbi:hypothetical protein [Priestia koreensis]|uniref:hypothetical protein n=1 Tax=Priestia koreensis TaxID=284581 RepID=UPI001F58D9CB|nr:hypothetical protein [Priestia koreensis]UNL86776.1 hypothetical protein IE339_09910 [Priestia koreensis]
MDHLKQATLTHKQLATSCFNKVWEYLELDERRDEDNEAMIHLCHSSFWHWTQVDGHTDMNLSVGYWQLSRVYAVIGDGSSALTYAKKCVSISENLDPFYKGCGHEACARAYKIMDNEEKMLEHKETAKAYVDLVLDEENKTWIENDLQTI